MTVSNIDADFDSWADNAGTETEVSGTLEVAVASVTGNPSAGQLRFPLAAITAGSTINDSDIQFNVTSENVETVEGISVRPYNDTGDDDPDGDDAATKYSRSTAPTTTLAEIDCSATGSKTADLGTTADGQIEGNISSPAFYSIGLEQLLQDAGEFVVLEAIENAGSDPATLTVDWTAGAGGDPEGSLIGGKLIRGGLLLHGVLGR